MLRADRRAAPRFEVRGDPLGSPLGEPSMHVGEGIDLGPEALDRSDELLEIIWPQVIVDLNR